MRRRSLCGFPLATTVLALQMCVHTCFSSDTLQSNADSLSLLTSSSAPRIVAANSQDSVSLDRMIVTAARSRRRASETPASVSVITASQIRSSPAKNIDDLLQQQVGVDVKRVVGIGEGVPMDIIIRGIPGALAATRTLVLVDGIPTNAVGTPFLILNEIPLDAVERVEIVRGPYSALYGANAFSGVINIITKTGDGPVGGLLSVESGYPFVAIYNASRGRDAGAASVKDAYWNFGGQGSGGNDFGDFLVDAGYLTIGNYLLHDQSLAMGDTAPYLEPVRNKNYRSGRMFVKGGVDVGSKSRLTLNARYFKSDLGFGITRKVSIDTAGINMQGEKFLVGPVLEVQASENLNLRFRAYYRHVTAGFLNEGQIDTGIAPYDSVVWRPTAWAAQTNDVDGEVLSVLRAGKYQVVTLGGDFLWNTIGFGATRDRWTQDTVIGSRGAERAIVNAGIFGQDEIKPVSELNIVPGARLDYHSVFGPVVSPKLGVSYRMLDKVTLRASAGRAYRAPTHTELYMPDLFIRPGFSLRSNASLKPEYVWASDGGFEIEPSSHLRLQCAAFYNSMTDLITPRAGFEDLRDSVVSYGNLTSAWSRGIEAEIEWQALAWLGFNGNLVWQASRDGKYGVALDYVPARKLALSSAIKRKIHSVLLEGTFSELGTGKRGYLNWQSPRLGLVINPDGTTEAVPPYRILEAYWRTDAALRCTIRGTLWVGLALQNIFNAQFEESGGTWGTGRFFTLSVGWNF